MLTGYKATQETGKGDEKHSKWEKKQWQGLLWESEMEHLLGVPRSAPGSFAL